MKVKHFVAGLRRGSRSSAVLLMLCGFAATPAICRYATAHESRAAAANFHAASATATVAGAARRRPKKQGIGRLIGNLSSGNYRRRRRAALELRRAGDAALPGLKKVRAAAPSPELQLETAQIIHAIQLFDLVGPTIVTFPNRPLPPSVVIDKLAKKLGVPLSGQNNGLFKRGKWAPITMPRRNTLLRDVYVLARKTHTVFDNVPHGYTYGNIRKPVEHVVGLAPASFFGPVMTQCTRVWRKSTKLQDTSLIGPRYTSHIFGLQLHCLSEGKLMILQLNQAVVDKATGTHGNFTALQLFPQQFPAGFQVWKQIIRFKWVRHPGKVIRTFRAHWTITAAGRFKKMTLHHLLGAHPAKLRAGPVVLRVVSAKRIKYGGRLILSFRPAGVAPKKSGVVLTARQMNQLCELLSSETMPDVLDARGVRYAADYSAGFAAAGNGYTCTIIVRRRIHQKIGPPATLTIKLPTKMCRFKVPIVFHNLPIP